MADSQSVTLAFTRALTELGFNYDLQPNGQSLDLGFRLGPDCDVHMRLQFRQADCVQEIYASLLCPADRALDMLALINMIHRAIAHACIILMPTGQLMCRSCLYTDPLPGQELIRSFLLEPLSLMQRILPACRMIADGKSVAEAAQTLGSQERNGMLN